MPSFIAFGAINSNSPNQNSGIFVGETNIAGWDANQKQSRATGSNLGIACAFIENLNLNFDNFEVIDGVINDQDFKASSNNNV